MPIQDVREEKEKRNEANRRKRWSARELHQRRKIAAEQQRPGVAAQEARLIKRFFPNPWGIKTAGGW
jgi:hypothetical protein